MEFWRIAYQYKWVTAEQLRLAVRTDSNPYGEITPADYEEITGIKF
ncbi:XkdX family protein [Brevibacillus laterosporus]|nr:XkdX family protein [Brevibacillus laterosporus]AUM66361.1 XkdX family protein [Brevibacillus laterosporus]